MRHSEQTTHLFSDADGAPKTYKQVLASYEKDELCSLVYYLNYNESSSKFQRLTKAKEAEIIFDLVTKQYNLWIDNLPLYDLQLLHDIIIDQRHKFPAASFIPFIVRFGFAKCHALKEEGSPMAYQLCPEIEKALAPHIEDALRRKKSSKTVALDQALWGLLNVYGLIPDFVLRLDLQTVMEAWNVKVSEKEIDNYLENSMMSLLCVNYDEKIGCNIYYSGLISFEAWADGVYKSLDDISAAPLDNFDRIKALGQYPNVKPYSPASKKFYDMLYEHLGKMTDFVFSYFYTRSQRGDYTPKDLLKEVMKILCLDVEAINNEELSIIQEFSNDMPRFYFFGYSPNDKMKQQKTVSRPNLSSGFPSSDPMSPFNIDTTPPLWPKVGRNDPCPCGSGKKFKNCHGRLN